MDILSTMTTSEDTICAKNETQNITRVNHKFRRLKKRNEQMRYASVCSGVEAASLAWETLGWKPVLFSEIQPFH